MCPHGQGLLGDQKSLWHALSAPLAGSRGHPRSTSLLLERSLRGQALRGLPHTAAVLNQIQVSRPAADQHRITLVVDVLMGVEPFERTELVAA